jgi:uncharacterized membrane protein
LREEAGSKIYRGELKKISTVTLKHHMETTVDIAKKEIQQALPKQFGITFDGWSDQGVHYLAVFAVGSDVPNVYMWYLSIRFILQISLMFVCGLLAENMRGKETPSKVSSCSLLVLRPSFLDCS